MRRRPCGIDRVARGGTVVAVMELTPPEQRVLGALVEKAMTTPDIYPLTTNALVAACNQASNRDPVMGLGEDVVLEAIGSLREEGLVRSVKRPEDRVMKHRHDLDRVLGLGPGPLAVIGVLLLRGAQTPGELRARTDRYTGVDPGAVDAYLSALARREEPLAELQERRPGQKESRWIHLLGPVPEATHREPTAGRPHRVGELEERVEALEEELASLRVTVEGLRVELGLD